MTTGRRCVTAAAILALFEGCFTVTRDISSYEQLESYRTDVARNLRVLATDTTFYELTSFSVHDSALEGEGFHITRDGRSPFAGQLPFSTLVYVQGRENTFGRTLVTAGFLGFVGFCTMGAAEHQGLSVVRPSTGSCPYIYAWNGSEHVLQGEAFGTAFGKALESTTACMLPAASVHDGTLSVRITNERPETHYIDGVRLLAFEAPTGATVLLDNVNRAWPVTQPEPPLQSPPELSRKDGIWWISDLSSASIGDTYRDVLDLTFPCPKDGSDGSLVIHAINTQLVNAVYDMVFGYLGDISLRFLQRVDTDPKCITLLKEWIRKCSLTIEVWKDDRWVFQGTLAPEAIAAEFSRIVRVASDGVREDSIRVRLSSLADMWSLDAVAMDWTPVEPLEPHPLVVRSAVHTQTGYVVTPLAVRDKDYAVLLPGEQIDVKFSVPRLSSAGVMAYALEATGYLYEWPLENTLPRNSLVQTVAFEPDRVEAVTSLIKHESVFLPLIYEQWRIVREALLK